MTEPQWNWQQFAAFFGADARASSKRGGLSKRSDGNLDGGGGAESNRRATIRTFLLDERNLSFARNSPTGFLGILVVLCVFSVAVG